MHCTLGQAVPLFVFFIITTAAVGAAMQAVVESAHVDHDASLPFFEQPMTYGIWAFMGDFDVTGWSTNEAHWPPILLFAFMIFNSIFLINLLIAQITTTYVRIDAAARAYRGEQMLDLVLVYKDEVRAPPPLNLCVMTFELIGHAIDQCHCTFHACMRLLLGGPRKERYRSLAWLQDARNSPGYAVQMDSTTAMRLTAKETGLMRQFVSKDDDDGRCATAPDACDATRAGQRRRRCSGATEANAAFATAARETPPRRGQKVERIHDSEPTCVRRNKGALPAGAKGPGRTEMGRPPARDDVAF